MRARRKLARFVSPEGLHPLAPDVLAGLVSIAVQNAPLRWSRAARRRADAFLDALFAAMDTHSAPE